MSKKRLDHPQVQQLRGPLQSGDGPSTHPSTVVKHDVSEEATVAQTPAAPSRRQFVARAAVAGAMPWIATPVVAQAANPSSESAGAESAASNKGRFEFALIGDMPYTRKQEAEYEALLEALNQEDLAFVVHIGDAMFDPRPYERNPDLARQPGADDNYAYVRGTFDSCRHPVIFTPGDNDWSDYVEFTKVKADPLDCLGKVRNSYFPEGRSMGQRTIALESQRADAEHAEYVENQRWQVGDILFATMHILGSNDNLNRSPELEEERQRRLAANLAWLDQTFEQAKERDSRGLVLIIHANPGFENHWPASYLGRYFRLFGGVKAPNPPQATPYDEWLTRLRTHMENWDRPTALLHGDTHLFRIDKPLFGLRSNRPFENFTRVETFGWPDTHWVRVSVDPDNPQLFTFTPQMVANNRQHHGT